MTSVNLVHRLVVESAERISPSFIRVIFGGDGLEGFVSSGVGDEYLRIFFPAEGETEPVLPIPSGDRGWEYREGDEPSPMRTYTVRAWDEGARRLTIDFVVHEGGVAAAWALRAKPGDVVGVNTPTPLYDPPNGMTWQYLIADATALPAAARLAEQVPPGVRTRIVVEVSDEGDRDAIEVPDGVELKLIVGGNGHAPTQLAQIVESIETVGSDGYIWVAGEAKATRAARKILRHQLGLPVTAYTVIGYWTENAEQWRERYESLSDEVKRELREMWGDESRSAEEIEDEYTERLEKLGL